MQKILIVNCVFSPEPVVSAQMGESLAVAMSELGSCVTVIVPYPSRPEGYAFDCGIPRSKKILKFRAEKNLNCYYLPSYIYPKSNMIRRMIESISFGYHSFKFIIKSHHEFDVVYMNTWPIFGQLGVAVACLFRRVPYVVHIMDIYPESFINKISNKVLKLLVKIFLLPIDFTVLLFARKVIVISNNMKSYLIENRKLNEQKLELVYTFQHQIGLVNELKELTKNKKVFMYLGNIGPVAGLPFLLEAFSTLNAKLVIAGSGSHREYCIEFSMRFPYLDVEFIKVPEGDVANIQSRADIMLLPLVKGSGFASIPSKLSSYMFSKKPIIVLSELNTDTAISVLEANCGWVTEYGNIEKFRNLLISIIDEFDECELEQMGISGYNYAMERFTKHKNLEKLINVLRSI